MSEEKNNPKESNLQDSPKSTPNHESGSQRINESRNFSEGIGDLIKGRSEGQYAKPFVNEIVQPVIPPKDTPTDNSKQD